MSLRKIKETNTEPNPKSLVCVKVRVWGNLSEVPLSVFDIGVTGELLGSLPGK